jgi:hypothetical protein
MRDAFKYSHKAVVIAEKAKDPVLLASCLEIEALCLSGCVQEGLFLCIPVKPSKRMCLMDLSRVLAARGVESRRHFEGAAYACIQRALSAAPPSPMLLLHAALLAADVREVP